MHEFKKMARMLLCVLQKLTPGDKYEKQQRDSVLASKNNADGADRYPQRTGFRLK